MSDPLSFSERQNRLFMVFRQAIEDERRAQETYREVMSVTDDPMLLAVFQRFCDDEARHERELLRLYNGFRERFLGDQATAVVPEE